MSINTVLALKYEVSAYCTLLLTRISIFRSATFHFRIPALSSQNSLSDLTPRMCSETYRKSSIKPRGAYLLFAVLEGGLNREGAY